MNAETLAGARSHGEQVVRRACSGGGSLGDSSEGRVEVVDRNQVARGGVDVVEPDGHRGKLRLERSDESLRVCGGEVRVPGSGVAAAIVAARLAGGLLDVRRRCSEKGRRL